MPTPAKILQIHEAVAILAVLLVGLLEGSSSQADGKEAQQAAQSREVRLLSEESLEILASGDAPARRGVAETACGRFEVLDPLMDDGSRSAEVVNRLRRYLHYESDDWISMRLLDNIACHSPGLVRPLFLDALASSSPNLRWRAFRWFAHVKEPEALPALEDSWPSEARAWARSDLIRALARNHSARFFDEFLDLAEDENPELASAAIGALKSQGDERAIPLLARLVRDTEEWRRKEAADALGAWPESPDALKSLLEASDAEEPEVRACALGSLSRMAEPSGMLRALATTLTDQDEGVRQVGVAALNSSTWHGVVDHLLSKSPERPGASRTELEELLYGVMNSLPGWQAKRFDNPAPVEDGNDREPRCVYHSRAGLDPENPISMRASPLQGMSSTRCFVYPEVTGDPRVGSRVARGSLLFVDDHFESPVRSWVRVDGFETAHSCWLPASQVVPASEEQAEEEQGSLSRDFDLPAREVWNSVFREMMQEGMIKIVEPGEEIAGVSLRVKMGDAQEEALLWQAAFASDSLLSTNIFLMIERAYTRVCNFPSLVKLAAELGFTLKYCPNASEAIEDPGSKSPASSDLPPDDE